MIRAMGDVEIAYGEEPHSPAIPVGGDMELYSHPNPYSEKAVPVAPISRLGSLRFSNGETFEIALVRGEDGTIGKGGIRQPRGALTHCDGFTVRDRATAWRGSKNERVDPRSVPEPVGLDERIDAKRLAARLRNSLEADDVLVLDTALDARSFREIGELVGYRGKTAERRGKVMLRDAAVRLQVALAT